VFLTPERKGQNGQPGRSRHAGPDGPFLEDADSAFADNCVGDAVGAQCREHAFFSTEAAIGLAGQGSGERVMSSSDVPLKVLLTEYVSGESQRLVADRKCAVCIRELCTCWAEKIAKCGTEGRDRP